MKVCLFAVFHYCLDDHLLHDKCTVEKFLLDPFTSRQLNRVLAMVRRLILPEKDLVRDLNHVLTHEEEGYEVQKHTEYPAPTSRAPRPGHPLWEPRFGIFSPTMLLCPIFASIIC